MAKARRIAYRGSFSGTLPATGKLSLQRPKDSGITELLVRTEPDANYESPSLHQLVVMADLTFGSELLDDVMIEVAGITLANDPVFLEGSMVLKLAIRTNPTDIGNAGPEFEGNRFVACGENGDFPRVSLRLLVDGVTEQKPRRANTLRWRIRIELDESDEDNSVPYLVLAPP